MSAPFAVGAVREPPIRWWSSDTPPLHRTVSLGRSTAFSATVASIRHAGLVMRCSLDVVVERVEEHVLAAQRPVGPQGQL